MASDYLTVKEIVSTIVFGLPELRKLSRVGLQKFSIDISLVAAGIRTGYLVDAFVLSDPADLFDKLIHKLRQHLDVFQSVVHIYDSHSEQSFIVNVALVQSRFGHDVDIKAESQWVTCVKLSDPPKLRSNAPEAVKSILQQLLTFSQDSSESINLVLPSLEHRQRTLIPLAALLLEYPVVYVPASWDQHDFLSYVPLNVFECRLRLPDDGSKTHSMLKFSCPCSLTQENGELSHQRMVERLKARFEERLGGVGLRGVLEVEHSVQTMARVAL